MHSFARHRHNEVNQTPTRESHFTRKQERTGQAVRFHAGGSSMQDLVALVSDAGFAQVETEEMQPLRFTAFPGVGILRAHKIEGTCPGKEKKRNERKRV
jgi:hypothetical protein